MATQPAEAPERELPVEELTNRQLLEEVAKLGRRIAWLLEKLEPLLEHPLARVYLRRKI